MSRHSLNRGVPAERAVFLRRRIIDRVGPLEESPPFAARVIGGLVRAALEDRGWAHALARRIAPESLLRLLRPQPGFARRLLERRR